MFYDTLSYRLVIVVITIMIIKKKIERNGVSVSMKAVFFKRLLTLIKTLSCWRKNWTCILRIEILIIISTAAVDPWHLKVEVAN